MHNYFRLFFYWHPELVSALKKGELFVKSMYVWKVGKEGFFEGNVNSKEFCLFQGQTNTLKVKYIAVSF